MHELIAAIQSAGKDYVDTDKDYKESGDYRFMDGRLSEGIFSLNQIGTGFHYQYTS